MLQVVTPFSFLFTGGEPRYAIDENSNSSPAMKEKSQVEWPKASQLINEART